MDEQFWAYAAIPVISAVVGWGTNWLAIRMAFYPVEFIGPLPPYIGWQGIVPRLTRKFGLKAADLVQDKLITLEEIFAGLDPDRMFEELEPILVDTLDEVANEVMQDLNPGAWEAVPFAVKKRIYARLQKEAPAVLRELMADVESNIHNVFDLKSMLIDAFDRDKGVLVRMFSELGKPEFRVLEMSGLYLGFLFGLVQMGIWLVFPNDWVLPLAGLFVGTATNWIAIKWIFEPYYPTQYGPWRIPGMSFGPVTLQGVFLKRQQQASADLAKFAEEELLTGDNIVRGLLHGPKADNLFNLLRKHLNRATEELAGLAKPLVVIGLGSQQYIRMKHRAIEAMVARAPQGLLQIQAYGMEAIAVERTLRERLQALPPEEFVDVLRPAIQEDEWLLIAVGGGLGFLTGIAQLVFLFGGSFF